MDWTSDVSHNCEFLVALHACWIDGDDVVTLVDVDVEIVGSAAATTTSTSTSTNVTTTSPSTTTA